jgi:gliding motility-associated-like protein
MSRFRLLIFLISFLAGASVLGQTGYTQRLNPIVSASDNDVCPNDEVELTLNYTVPDNTSLLLNGLDELVNVGSNPNFSFGTSTDFTIEYFIKTTDLGTQTVVSKGSIGTPGYAVGMASGFVVAIASDGGATPIVVNGFTNVADGSWHHIAVVFDRDDKITIYTDGFFDNDGNMTTIGSVDNIDLLRIGAFNNAGTPTQYFNGYIDEVRIWNSALTVAEINARSTTHLNPASYPNLVANWDMNDVTAPTIIDCSQSSADGQMVGSASLSLDAPSLTFPFLAQWNFGATGSTQFVSPTDTTQYICTIGYCKYASIDSITINVIECEDEDNTGIITSVWVPSAFTPNGDFKNDVFEVQGSFLTFYEIKIFNRMGNIMYHSRNILNSWDGTFEGERVKDDVYTYIITYRDVEGNEHKKYGTVAVLR